MWIRLRRMRKMHGDAQAHARDGNVSRMRISEYQRCDTLRRMRTPAAPKARYGHCQTGRCGRRRRERLPPVVVSRVSGCETASYVPY